MKRTSPTWSELPRREANFPDVKRTSPTCNLYSILKLRTSWNISRGHARMSVMYFDLIAVTQLVYRKGQQIAEPCGTEICKSWKSSWKFGRHEAFVFLLLLLHSPLPTVRLLLSLIAFICLRQRTLCSLVSRAIFWTFAGDFFLLLLLWTAGVCNKVEKTRVVSTITSKWRCQAVESARKKDKTRRNPNLRETGCLDVQWRTESCVERTRKS